MGNVNYKGFKIIPATKRNCSRYCVTYIEGMENEFLIIDAETDEFEIGYETVAIAKQWIDCY